MRSFLILAALAAMVLVTGEAQAARRQVVNGNGTTVARGDGFFSRLMELERRKNAALFGGLRR
ncbi:MAG: hypothetical protein AABP62_08350 [Planctomycetota bacterium]